MLLDSLWMIQRCQLNAVNPIVLLSNVEVADESLKVPGVPNRHADFVSARVVALRVS